MDKIVEYLTFFRSNLHYELQKLLIENLDLQQCLEFLKITKTSPKTSEIKKEAREILENGCKILTIDNQNYPLILKKTSKPPLLLTIKGNEKLLSKKSIAFVGSRDLINDDIKIISNLVKNVASLDFNIVSGLALGTDALAHIHSLKTGTIAVLPSGIGNIYPHQNEFLAKKILNSNGLLISEYKFDEHPQKSYFLDRNRIIAGLSSSVLAMRSKNIRSGTLSTVNFAKKDGRPIYTYDFYDNCEGNKYIINNKIAEKIENENFLYCMLFLNHLKLENELNNRTEKPVKKSLFSNTISQKDIKKLLQNEGINHIDETNFVKICNFIEKKLKITTKEAVVALFEIMN